MKKLLLLLSVLLTGVSGAWAETININGSTGTENFHIHGFGLSLPASADAGKVYSFSSFSIGLRGDSNVQPYYMAICTQKKATSSSAFNYDENNVIAVSSNAPTANYAGRFEYRFSQPVKLIKGVVYYVQFFTSNTPSNGVYSAVKQGVYVKTGADNDYPDGIYSNSGSWTKYTLNFTTTLTDESTSEVNPWVSMNSNNISHAGINKLKLITPNTNKNYRLSSLSLYISSSPSVSVSSTTNYMIISTKENASGSIGTGDVLAISQNNPSCTSGDNIAERFLFDDVLLDGNTAYYLYFTPSNVASEGSYTLELEKVKLSKTTGDDKFAYFTNAWQNWEPRYYTTLNVLKTVNFIDDGGDPFAVSVNGGSAVSSIYVATDGSDLSALSLTNEYKYSLDNGDSYLTASDAATAIASAGTSDITVKVGGYMDLVTANINPFINNPGTGYFELPSTYVSMMSSAIDTYNADGIISYSEYTTLLSALQDDIIYPTAGYYRLKNKGANAYMGVSGSDFVGNITAIASNSDPSTIINIERSGKFGVRLSTQGKYGQAEAGGNAPTLSDTPPASYFTLEPSLSPGYGLIRTHSREDSYYSVYEGAISTWTAAGNTEYWAFEQAISVDVSLSAVGEYTYSTLGLPFGVTLPADVKAYILTEENGWAVPTEISEVPAGTGVLLRGTSSSVTSATLTIKADASAGIDISGNKLRPTYVDITGERSAGEYILGNGEDGLGFYQRNSERKIGANKAYLQLDADITPAAGVKGILLSFDELVDGIGLTPAPSLSKRGEEVIFNLSGQRMSRVQKGVNIVNGQKVLVK